MSLHTVASPNAWASQTFACQRCGSDTRSFEMVYVASSDAIAGGHTATQDDLAAKVTSHPAPPQMESGYLIALLCFLMSCVVTIELGPSLHGFSVPVFLLIFIGGMAVNLGTRNWAYQRKMKTYHQQIAEWRRLWICLGCGDVRQR